MTDLKLATFMLTGSGTAPLCTTLTLHAGSRL
jgi:hypothetical protein